MPPQTDLLTSRSCDVGGRPAAAATGYRGVATPSYLSAVLTDLSASVSRIHALAHRHGDDGELLARLRRTVTELEALISHLLHMDGSGPSQAASRRSTASTSHRLAAEKAFLVWLTGPTSVDEVTVSRNEEPEPLARVLGELSLSGRVLPAESAAGIGLPAGATVGRAAAELLIAVRDPAGPRCRSFRAAVYYLRDLDRGRSVEPDDGKVGR